MMTSSNGIPLAPLTLPTPRQISQPRINSPARLNHLHHQLHITNHYKFLQTQAKPATIQVLPKTTPTTTTSSFEIPTQSEPVTSPITCSSPWSDQNLSFSPHEPPYIPDSPPPPQPHPPIHNYTHHAHHAQNQNQNQHLQPSRLRYARTSDVFTDYVEHRYARFRPAQSQHNNEMVMANQHPFQAEEYGARQRTIYESIASWFANLAKPPQRDIEMGHAQAPQTDDEEGEEEKSPSCAATFTHRDINGSNPGSGTGSPAVEPVYTPRGIPINEYPLNFHKSSQAMDNMGEENERRTAIVNSFDEEVRDLVDGTDNFLTSCIDGIWVFASGVYSTCIDPFNE
ncbi:uncharacterized protein LODBEIA_P22060 [Lodderomyces beijingensis]|uniref:Uncharacterized protein n=1 Tax=Lodderomyces beijingensis TaxID=1775926 RepID=A0ABP0ZP93_9ASCO